MGNGAGPFAPRSGDKVARSAGWGAAPTSEMMAGVALGSCPRCHRRARRQGSRASRAPASGGFGLDRSARRWLLATVSFGER